MLAKLEAAGLTDAQKIVLAVATGSMVNDAGDVVGFGRRENGREIPEAPGGLLDFEIQLNLGNFEIQDLMARFDHAESKARAVLGG